MNFDNILVTLLRGKTRQINHYYPYGLSISGIGGDYDEYLNKYTGKELQFNGCWAQARALTAMNTETSVTGEFDPAVSTGLEMFDFHARFYDPQIGRWFTPDPAEQFHNPYLAMGNNPAMAKPETVWLMYVDPDGRTVEEIAWDPHNTDDWGMMSGGDGGMQDESTMWRNLIYDGGAPSSNSWVNGFRSEEYNEVFLTRKIFNEQYGYDKINIFDVDRSDKEEVWNKALGLSVKYELNWRILWDYRKPNGDLYGVHGDYFLEPVWSPLGTPQNFGADQSFRVDYPSRGSSDSFASRAKTGLDILSAPMAVKMELLDLSGQSLGWYGNLMRRPGQTGAGANIILSGMEYSNNEISGANFTYDLGWSALGASPSLYAQAWYWSGVAGQYWGPSTWGWDIFGPDSYYGQFKYWIHKP